MTILSGAMLVLADRVLESGTLVIEGDRIADVVPGPRAGGDEAGHQDLHGHVIVPGFVDVHVHGVEGVDSLGIANGEAPVAAIAERLVRYGVTAFCPTTVACSPADLRAVFAAIREARGRADWRGARVLPAHLESNFINPDYRGAQPLTCLRVPGKGALAASDAGESYTGDDVLDAIASARSEVAIVTLAPEIEGGIALARTLAGHGHLVSLGHSGATYEQGLAGIDAGARHATHLFNRMPPLRHRDPGLVGAVLDTESVAAEIIFDAYHVHPAVARAAVAVKTPARTMAITDGTAGSGLPVGSRTTLGGRPITVRDTACFLDDDTLAGSSLTMDEGFRRIVQLFRFTLVDAAQMCAATPARELALADQGRLQTGFLADFAVLDADLRVVQTWVGGRRVFGG